VGQPLRRRIHSRLPGRLKRIASQLWRNWQGLVLYLATLVGWLPSHGVRLWLYRHVFGVHIGHGSTIHWQCRFFDPARVTIGNHTLIGNNAFLDGRAGLYIGNNVVTASEVAIYTAQHDIDDPEFGIVYEPVVVEDYVYIGPRAIILPGVRIGRGSAVGAGSVVTKDVAPHVLVGGVPARYLRDRSCELGYEPHLRTPFQ